MAMHVLRFILPLSFVFMGHLPSAAQDSLLLMNGKTLLGDLDETRPTEILLEVPRRNGKSKFITYERDEIYSYHKQGKDSIVYQQDPFLGYELSQGDMRSFMFGQNDARQAHPVLIDRLGGFAVGLGSTLALDGGAIPFLTPIVYSLGMQIPIVKVKDSAINDRMSAISPYYLEGYNATARSKKFTQGFLSTMAGVLLGSGIILLTE